MGKGSSSGGGGTTTSTQTVTPPPQVLAAYQQALGMANTAASAPLQQYQGQQVAGFSPDQLAAFQTTANTAGAYQPYLNTASQDIQNSTTPLWSSVPQFSAANVNQYQSPYTQNVLDTTMAAENNQDAQQQNQVVGNAVASGAWGGDRSAVAQAQVAGQQAIANNATNAGIENTGYNTALGEFNNQQQSNLSANEANSYLNSQAGFGNLNLASTATGLPLEQASAQSSAGSQEQALAQEQLNVPYEQFLQQQAYPFQTAQYYSNIAEGLSNQGSTGTTSTTSPGASTASQVGGGLLGAGSLLGASGAFGENGWLASGGRAPSRLKRDFGGGIPAIPNFDATIVPTTEAGKTSQLQLPQIPRSGSDGGSGGSSSLSGISGLASLAKLLGNSGGGLTSTDSSSMPGLNGVGSLGNIFGSGSGVDPDTGNSLASQNYIDQDFLSSGDVGSSGLDFFSPSYRGGRAKHAIGGEVFPEVVSGIGDVVGAFFGDPMAGDQGVGLLSAIDGGRTNGQGDVSRVFGSLSNTENSGGTGLNSEGQAGQMGLNLLSMLARGGRARYDNGGMISPVVGAQPTAADSNQIQQNFYQQVSQLPMDKLQELQMRMPATTPQGQMVQKAIQQKQFMPTNSQAGISTPAAPQAGTQIQTPAAQSGFAMGGRPRYDDGGNIAPLDASSDDTQDNTPTAGLSTDNNVVPFVPPAQSYNPPQANTQMVQNYQPPAPANKNAEVSPWEALAAAGFGMMAGTSPQAGVNIGRGALAGLQNFEQQKQQVAEQNQKSRSLDQEAQRLADEADYRNKSLALDTQKQTTISPVQQAEIDARNKGLSQTAAYQNAEISNMSAERQKPIPDGMGGFIIPNLQDPQNPKHIAAAGMTAPALDENGTPLTGDSYLATLPPDRAAQIKALDSGNMPFPSGFALKSPYFQQMLNQLYQYNPNASAQTAGAIKAFNTGQQGNQTRFLNVAVNHLDTLNQLTDALNNGDVKAVNAIGNLWNAQTGSPAPTNFNTAKQIVGDEVTKAVLGAGGTGADREKAQAVIDAANSPEQLKGAIQTYQHLMTGQLAGLKQQYEVSTGRKDYDRYLTDAAKKALLPAQQSSVTQSPVIPALDQRQIGQTYTNPNGVSAKWTGTGWVTQ